MFSFSRYYIYQFTLPQPDMRLPGAVYPHQHLALCVFNFCHSGADVVVFHCAFNLYFRDD